MWQSLPDTMHTAGSIFSRVRRFAVAAFKSNAIKKHPQSRSVATAATLLVLYNTYLMNLPASHADAHRRPSHINTPLLEDDLNARQVQGGIIRKRDWNFGAVESLHRHLLGWAVRSA